MATHTLITGLEEYVRESFVSVLCVRPSCVWVGKRGCPCCLCLLDLKVLSWGSWCVLSQSLVQVQPGVDIIRTNLEFLQEQFNSIAAHVLHCTGQAGGQPSLVHCPCRTARITCPLPSSLQTVDLEPGCWSYVTRACLNAWP